MTRTEGERLAYQEATLQAHLKESLTRHTENQQDHKYMLTRVNWVIALIVTGLGSIILKLFA